MVTTPAPQGESGVPRPPSPALRTSGEVSGTRRESVPRPPSPAPRPPSPALRTSGEVSSTRRECVPRPPSPVPCPSGRQVRSAPQGESVSPVPRPPPSGRQVRTAALVSPRTSLPIGRHVTSCLNSRRVFRPTTHCACRERRASSLGDHLRPAKVFRSDVKCRPLPGGSPGLSDLPSF